MRELNDWKIGKFTTEHIIVTATDEKDVDGANHQYSILVFRDALSENGSENNEVVEDAVLQFQQGGLADVGANGISDQALLGIVMDRMVGFQQGPYSCDENDEVINLLDKIAGIMKKRYADRSARGVEGERKV